MDLIGTTTTLTNNPFIYTVLCCCLMVLCWRGWWCMIDYHFIKVICLIWNASQPHQQMSLEALHTLCSDSILSRGTGILAIVIHSPLTQKNFNKRLSLSIYIIYPWAVTFEVQIVFQALKPQPRDFIHFSSRCSGDKVPGYHLYLRLSMFHAQYKWSQTVHCISLFWTKG